MIDDLPSIERNHWLRKESLGKTLFWLHSPEGAERLEPCCSKGEKVGMESQVIEKAMTSFEISELLGVSQPTFRKWRRMGLPGVQFKTRAMFVPSMVLNWVRANESKLNLDLIAERRSRNKNTPTN